jgi:hypothetical protein
VVRAQCRVGATAVHGEPPNTPTAIDADPPVTHGPSLHTFGETQTLEARGVSVITSCV